jgi:ankyrin repeat protein
MEENQKELMKVLNKGQLREAEEILEKHPQIDVNKIKDEYGTRPIHFATYKHDSLAFVKYLIEQKGANVNIKDDYEQTPLVEAVKIGCATVCRYLIDNGADVNAKDVNDRTALMEAAWRGYLNICQLLVEHDANVTAEADDGSTAISYSAMNSHLEIVKYLSWKGGVPLKSHEIFSENGGNEHKRRLVAHYFDKSQNREILIALASAKMVNRLGSSSPIIMLKTDLLRLLFQILDNKL